MAESGITLNSPANNSLVKQSLAGLGCQIRLEWLATHGAWAIGESMITTSALQKNTNVQQHTPAQTILFHLLPGLLITFVFSAMAALMTRFNLPPSLALLTTWLVAG